ncbi:protein translocase subunit secA [Panacagrimonas perspica]|uniref:Protein translocase subunit SecA n=1 Tax=Panacagrimonas perspica TaxID=381431 RepID=A0A4R7NYL2_9GAMM|nr:preprotein translocase subunit SecA [Panacagrimonas perspica]TDU26424.1 protein translocase subunit secA [Panacagrimonas perspica]THD02053.1 preprotein translocase subunit SecA [Panacagrimonas perspica]
MPNNWLARLFGSRNQRIVRGFRGLVKSVGDFESKFAALSDADLAEYTLRFRERLAQGETLKQIQPEAFACVREAGKRVLGMRHFDVQLIGGAVLNEGKIAEMRTGEGKTLVATLGAYLNALEGKGVHVVTVNDYLARRDADWMGRIFRFLGLSVGVIVSGQSQAEKREAYACDITYATNNELGFDYLRDNMAFALKDKVQRGQHYAIIDEVDSILIDEARTPLIISGATDDDPELYRKINAFMGKLVRQKEEEGEGDFWADEKSRQVHLSEAGHEKLEDLMRSNGLLSEDDSLYDAANIILMHHTNALLRAHHLYRKDVEYIVRNGQIVIIDEFTGRMMAGRRWSDGLHQAIEAKESVKIQQENQTLASITFQNYFRLYKKLSGMTGTADTEAFEFQSIYGLEVVVIPTNRPMIRDDRGDQVFISAKEKFEAVIGDIKTAHQKQQPILVGTASIETSELLSGLLQKEGITHEVLNAKQHEREAEIVAQAGRPGGVTIATNMAGRGTDIVLGGSLESELALIPEDDAAARASAKAAWQKRHDDVLASGGLLVIGSERHESRRIDNQLRGRSGRQGDPGASRFYLSLDDTLMRIFTPPRMRAMLMGLGMQPGEAIEHRWVTRAIETAQRKVEGHNFDIRKNLLEYDNVANDQRKAIYELRDELMGAERVTPLIDEIRGDVIQSVIDVHLPPQSVEDQWNIAGLEEALKKDFNLPLPIKEWLEQEQDLDEKKLRARIADRLADAYSIKREKVGAPVLEHFEKAISLQVLDKFWQEHLAATDYMRQGIHLRGYAQKDPKQEFKREAFTMFNDMLARFKHEVIAVLGRVQIQTEEEVQAIEEKRRAAEARPMQFQHANAPDALQDVAAGEPAAGVPAPAASAGRPLQAQPAHAPAAAGTFVRDTRKVGRNDPCPCGSGQKYKSCHGKLA